MQDKQRIIEHIRQAFSDTERPDDAFLQGSYEGCEPGESVAPFIGIADWTQLDPVVLDGSYNALSFFSEGGSVFPSCLSDRRPPSLAANRRPGVPSHEWILRQGHQDSRRATDL